MNWNNWIYADRLGEEKQTTKRNCNQICRWNDPSDGCIIPTYATCPMANTEPDASGWGQVNEKREKRLDLIDRGALIEKKRQYCCGHGEYNYMVELWYIENAPTVDAAEVVRCGECRFVDTKKCPMSGSAGRVSASDFCSFGERRTDNERKAD